MKKLNIKNLKLFSLSVITATTLMMNGLETYAKENEVGIELTNEESDWQYEGEIKPTDYYFLIRINGNIYLTTGNYEYNDQGEKITHYYDIRNGEFVGQTIKTDFDKKANILFENERFKYLEENGYEPQYRDGKLCCLVNNFLYHFGGIEHKFSYVVDAQKKDHMYFDGEYGYGKNLPTFSIIALNKFITASYPSKKDLFFYSSNCEDVVDLFENKIKYGTYEYQSCAQYFCHFRIPMESDEDKEITREETKVIESHIKKIKYEDLNGNIITTYGYRCSDSDKDNGYSYFYDIVKGDIYNISNSNTRIKLISIEDSIEKENESGTIDDYQKISKTEKKVKAIDIWYLPSDDMWEIKTYNDYADLYEIETLYMENPIEFISKLNNLTAISLFNLKESINYKTKDIFENISSTEGINEIMAFQTEISISDLEKFKNLEYLGLYDCDITNISKIANFEKVSRLDVVNSTVDDIEALNSLNAGILTLVDNQEISAHQKIKK